jgi:SAM-dependent methyltransferase
MKEASKTNRIRGPAFAELYLRGNVLDVGAGDDLVCASARRFDACDGDANHLRRYFEPESFDTVHSSHCLEHMIDPAKALTEWWTLVKPQGYLIIVVPEETLYEQHIWPSRFNTDHKATFRLGGVASWSPVSKDIGLLCLGLPGAEIVSAEIQDHNYDRKYLFPAGRVPRMHRPWFLRVALALLRLAPAMARERGSKHFRKIAMQHGYPFDQTAYDASAQIQVIARKAPRAVGG